MYVLIINAFEKGSEIFFKDFVEIIKKLLYSICPPSGLAQITFITKAYDQLEEFIYEKDDGIKMKLREMNDEKKFKFERLDFIFIDGNAKFLPWDKVSLQIVKFFKLCIINNKNLFAAGIGSCILTYLLAIGLNSDVNVINKKCKSINEISGSEEVLEARKKLNKHDYFLEYSTGDLYGYQLNENSNAVWQPVMNVGMHNSSASEKYKQFKTGISFTIPYKILHDGTEIITSLNNEIKVFIPNKFYSHHLFKSLPQQFLVYSTNEWFPHQFFVTDSSLESTMLAESKKGFIILERGPNLACFFNIKKKYKDSLKLLENYIIHKSDQIKKEGYAFDKVIEQLNDKKKKQEELNIISSDIINYEEVEQFVKKIKRDLESNHEFNRECENKKDDDDFKNKINKFKISGEKKRDKFFVEKESLVTINNALTLRPYSTCNFRSSSSSNKNKSQEFNSNEKSKKFINSDNIKVSKSNNFAEDKTIQNLRKQENSLISSQSNSEKINKMTQFYSSLQHDDDVNVFSIVFPYVSEDQFPKPVTKHIVGSGFEKNKIGKEVIRLELYKKQQSNYEKLYKKYEKDLNSFAKRVSIFLKNITS
jgi:hypothetical protein